MLSISALQLEPPPRSVATSSPPSRWLNVLSHLDPKYGGLSTVVPQLCSSLTSTDLVSVELAAFCLADEQFLPSCLPAHSTTFWPVSRSTWWTTKDLASRLHEAIGQADGVHIHGLWEQSTDVTARIARSLRKPYLISAHGMLDPWALRNKRWKKRIYASFTERANVRHAACLHALTQAEADDYRRFGGISPIAVIPNAVRAPERLDDSHFLQNFPALRGKRIILFLGRIHYKKGLDLLIESWAALAKQWPDAHLVLCGPDSEDTQRQIEERIRKLEISDRVVFTGMLDAAMKWSALAAAQCFVLPSYSEGLSTSVLEAMAAGLPVIITEECHMPEVSEYKCGWVIEARVDDLTHALEAFLKNSAAANRAIGSRGKSLVEQRYSWPSVARRMAEVYRWLAGGDIPKSVDLIQGRQA